MDKSEINGRAAKLLLRKRASWTNKIEGSCPFHGGKPVDYLAAMRAFVRSVDLGSFSKAAGELDLKVSTVSRYVSGLEADLGVALLNRSTRALHLTEAGILFYDRALAVLSDFEDARSVVAALNAKPQGLLRITIPGAFSRRHIIPYLKQFCALYPDIRLDISITEATVDLIDAGIDVAIRIGALEDSTLVARRLTAHHRLLVASPEYLREHGIPKEPGDLADHRCLLFARQWRDDVWFHGPAGERAGESLRIKISGRVRVDDSDALLQAARDGLGIGLLPTWILADDLRSGRLIPLITHRRWSIAPGAEPAIHAVYPPKKTVSPKVRAFVDFVAKRFGSPPYWEVPDAIARRQLVSETVPVGRVGAKSLPDNS